jgi:hypothetical protein
VFFDFCRLDGESIAVLNAVDGGKFPLLVSRMAQGMQISDKGDAFSKEELLKLEASLQLDEQTLKQLLDSITLVLTQVKNTQTHCDFLLMNFCCGRRRLA